MNLTFFSFSELGDIYYCPFCGKKHNEAYSLDFSNENEWDILTNDLGDISNGLWYVCENCLGGYCGAVPGKTPTKWFDNVYPRLTKQLPQPTP